MKCLHPAPRTLNRTTSSFTAQSRQPTTSSQPRKRQYPPLLVSVESIRRKGDREGSLSQQRDKLCVSEIKKRRGEKGRNRGREFLGQYQFSLHR